MAILPKLLLPPPSRHSLRKETPRSPALLQSPLLGHISGYRLVPRSLTPFSFPCSGTFFPVDVKGIASSIILFSLLLVAVVLIAFYLISSGVLLLNMITVLCFGLYA